MGYRKVGEYLYSREDKLAAATMALSIPSSPKTDKISEHTIITDQQTVKIYVKLYKDSLLRLKCGSVTAFDFRY
jgi:hypothetical protein